MEIQLQEGENKGFAVALEGGVKAGMMTFSNTGRGLIIIDHTDVSEEFSGKGVGKKLLYKIVEMAREKEMKILPLCPFANAMFKKLDDIQDVLKA